MSTIPHDESLMGEEQERAWRDVAAVLNTFGLRKTLVALGKLVYFDTMQRYESIGDVPDLDSEVVSLARKWSTPCERGEATQSGAPVLRDPEIPF